MPFYSNISTRSTDIKKKQKGGKKYTEEEQLAYTTTSTKIGDILIRDGAIVGGVRRGGVHR
jgi:hypothetical protein